MSDKDRTAGESAAQEATTAESATRLYPLDPRWMTTLFYVGLLAWAIVLLIPSLEWSWQNRLFPMIFTILAIVLACVQLFLLHFEDRLRWLIPETSETGSDEMNIEQNIDAEGRSGRERERYELVMIGWVLVLPALLEVIGFLFAIPIYTFAFIWYFLRDVRTAVLTSALATAFVYLLFVRVLGIRLPEGILFA